MAQSNYGKHVNCYSPRLSRGKHSDLRHACSFNCRVVVVVVNREILLPNYRRRRLCNIYSQAAFMLIRLKEEGFPPGRIAGRPRRRPGSSPRPHRPRIFGESLEEEKEEGEEMTAVFAGSSSFWFAEAVILNYSSDVDPISYAVAEWALARLLTRVRDSCIHSDQTPM